MSERGRVETVKLARNPVTRRLRVPEGFPANGDPQAGHTDLTHVDDNRSIGTLRGMVTRAARRWMRMGMRLMRVVYVVHVVMRIVHAVRMRAVDVVMRIVEAVMGIVDALMGIVTC